MAPSKSSHRRQALGVGLTATTLIFAVGVVCSVGTFAWRELIAREQLQKILADASAAPSPTGTSDRPGSLQSWLDSNTSKRDTDAWGRVLNEISGPYVKSQLETLFTLPSDDPLDWDFRKPGESSGSISKRFAWSVYPEELTRFLETVRPLLERIHALCKDDSPVYIPIVDQGDKTSLHDYQLLASVSSLLSLECADAVHRKDAERLIVALNSLHAVQEKFAIPNAGSYYLTGMQTIVISNALHLALDGEMLDAAQRREWIERLRRGTYQPERLASIEQESNTNLISALASKRDKSSFLDGADALPTRISRLSKLESNLRDNAHHLLVQDYYQSALVRVALTLMAMEQKNAPKSLTDIPSSLLQARDWTNAQGVPLDYTFDAARRVGILKPKRLKVDYHSDTPLRDAYEIDFSDRPQQP